jgi:uncharacterized LabA/DUF88 family protein
MYTDLQGYGYVLVFKKVTDFRNSDGKITHKGNVDAEIVLHSLLQIENYDKAVIVSNDGDFYCLIEHLENEGKLLKIIYPNSRYSQLLRKYESYILTLDVLQERFTYIDKKMAKTTGRTNP